MLSTTRVARTLALTALTALAIGGTASAATKNGITPLAPKAGTSVPAGKAATFRMKVADPGAGVFVHVCKSNKRDKQGMICKKATILQAKKRKGAWEAKQTFFDFPAFWLNNPGTYYWQAYRIECRSGSSDCKQEGPVVRFKVK
ncbi:MAG TPA: hypothetical protein VFN44_21525 [Solirubrobacteraceae bacterium]|nr:hypothetical protein [Solirubrobacteraceae bacterium]